MTLSKLLLPLFSVSSVFLLGACGYAVDSSHQDITFLTPGAQNAKCYVYSNKLKYKVYPPQTLDIKKSTKDLEVKCDAPGNRTIEMTVPAMLSKHTMWGGPPGVLWDYASQSMYYYPSVVAIDFSQEKLKSNKLPQHNNSDIRQPETHDLEEFTASQPRLNSDKYIVEHPIVRRGEDTPEEYIGDDAMQEKDGGGLSDGKSNLQSVFDSLAEPSNTMEEQRSDGASDLSGEVQEAVSEPVQIYPGQ